MLNKTDELKDRVEAKRRLMLSRLAELKADTRHEASSARDKITRGLAELESHLTDGWVNLSDGVLGKLDEWLKRN